MRGLLAGIGIMLLVSSTGLGHGPEPWPVPEEAKKRKNLVGVSSQSLKLGKMLYRGNCLLCHGSKGDGKGPWAESLPVPAGDFTDRHMMSEMTDGELFWKISKGRGEMPRFETHLSEEQRWHVVNYVRELGKGKPRPTAAGKRE